MSHSAAACRLQGWYRQHALPPLAHSIYTHGGASLRLWRRTYLARYPAQHVRDLVTLIPRKLHRPELACTDGRCSRRTLAQQLARMSVGEIAAVGW